jgi:tryptophan halogenase
LFDHKNFLYVLYGMKFNTEATVLSAQEVKHCEALMTGNDQLVVKAASMLLKHRDWLEGLKQAFEQARSTKV